MILEMIMIAVTIGAYFLGKRDGVRKANGSAVGPGTWVE